MLNTIAGYIDTEIAAIETKLDSPDNFKADVSALALEATLTAIKGAGWTTETLKVIKDAIDALNNLAASEVWAYATRTLTSHAFPFTNPAAALDVTNIRTAAYTLLTDATYGLSALNDDLDTLLARLTAARAGYLDELDFDLNARLGSPAGASISADILTIDNLVDDLETRVPAEVTQRAKSLYVLREKFFADSVRITLNTSSSNEAIKTNFSISLIPTGVTLDYVHVYVFAQVVENTNAAANKVNGAQNIQIQKNSGGSWTNCVSVLDDALRVPATTRDMGRLIGAPVDCKAQVDGNTAYDIQWTSSVVDQASMYLDDVFFIVEIGFH